MSAIRAAKAQSNIIHVDAVVIAITGAILLMLSIFFFAGLFSLVGGLQEVGLIKAFRAY